MKKQLLFIFITLFAFKVSAQQYVLSGRVTDAQNHAIPFASVYIRNSTYGTTANEIGGYQFKLKPGTYHVIYRFVGYQEHTEMVVINNRKVVYNVQLKDEVFKLKAVVVQGKRLKTDTTANNIMRQVIAKREYYLNEVKEYSVAAYVKGVQRLLGAPKAFMGRPVRNTLDLDSLGRGILFQTESISDFDFQQPNKVRELTIATKTVGLNPTFGFNKASDLQVNFYRNRFFINGLSDHGFVSPMAYNAFRYYKYKLVGTTIENGRVIDKIQVAPRLDHSATFKGNVYILEGDWRIYSVDLFLTNHDNGLSFIDTLEVSQQYIPIADSVWQPVSAQYTFSGKVLGFKFGGYYDAIYNNYNLKPNFPDHYFTGEILRYDTASNTKDSAYWASKRPVPLTRQEARDYFKKDSTSRVKRSQAYLDSAQQSNNRLLIVPYLLFGHTSTYKNGIDSIYLQPIIQTFFYNTVEGYGINLEAKYTHKINDFQSWDVTPNVRYGFSNKMFTANINGDYNYDPFHNAKMFGGFGSDVLDLNNVGTRSLYFNTISTLFSERNYVKYYKSEYGNLGYQRELANGVLWTVSMNYANRTQLFNTSFNHAETFSDRQYTSNNPLKSYVPGVPDAPADDHSVLFPQNQALTFFTSFRLTFDQQYIIAPKQKINLPSKYPVVTLSYRQGINGVLSSDVDYNFGSVNISQSAIPIGVFGYSSFSVTGGDFFNRNKIYFPDYNHFLGNQGTTFDPTYVGSFHFLPFYTFSTANAFLEAHYQHNFSGMFLNNIPFLRKFKLEEIVGANYLSEKDHPNYSEFYVGLQRLIFRIDYGVSYEGQKKYIQGIRIFYGIR
ncbi:MAG: DUF5686 and carboxypeptidase regulatory-like domain-containing protein [Sphingobacteriales bacterium]